MRNIERLVIKDGDEYVEVFVQSTNTSEMPPPEMPPVASDSEYESYGAQDAVVVQLEKVHAIIQAYTKYAIGAFKNLGEAEVEEITLKFGLKMGGTTGVPLLTEASAESNFNIEVKCKFPDKPKGQG